MIKWSFHNCWRDVVESSEAALKEGNWNRKLLRKHSGCPPWWVGIWMFQLISCSSLEISGLGTTSFVDHLHWLIKACRWLSLPPHHHWQLFRRPIIAIKQSEASVIHLSDTVRSVQMNKFWVLGHSSIHINRIYKEAMTSAEQLQRWCMMGRFWDLNNIGQFRLSPNNISRKYNYEWNQNWIWTQRPKPNLYWSPSIMPWLTTRTSRDLKLWGIYRILLSHYLNTVLSLIK